MSFYTRSCNELEIAIELGKFVKIPLDSELFSSASWQPWLWSGRNILRSWKGDFNCFLADYIFRIHVVFIIQDSVSLLQICLCSVKANDLNVIFENFHENVNISICPLFYFFPLLNSV